MAYCTECGKKNDDDAKYCKKCGTELIDIKTTDSIKSKKVDESVEEKIEKIASKFEETAERIGKRIEHRFERPGKSFEQWSDKTFGIIGPLIGSFLVIIILRIAIWGMIAVGEDYAVIGKIGSVLYDYLLLIYISILISSYNTYLLRKYKTNYQWISPCISTVTFIIGLWVVAKIFVVIDTELDISILASLAHVIETYLIVIFFVVILISYGLKLVTTPLGKK
ncbi:MAG: zinc-ribbon domain-containing protein [Thermoplasmatales archaeon]|jgi:ribosomal protein L40E|nr:MAG: zinc-ribbon domain-containing protein [Thermoplasmatales archaeon]